MKPSVLDANFLDQAIALSTRCPPSRSAFSVGAIIVDARGTAVGAGFSREGGAEALHAEEAALLKARQAGHDLVGATLYSSLEPCGQRRSGRPSCVEHILKTPIVRVVYAWGEPDIFVAAVGAEKLARAGIEVVVLGAQAAAVERINSHIIQNFISYAP